MTIVHLAHESARSSLKVVMPNPALKGTPRVRALINYVAPLAF